MSSVGSRAGGRTVFGAVRGGVTSQVLTLCGRRTIEGLTSSSLHKEVAATRTRRASASEAGHFDNPEIGGCRGGQGIRRRADKVPFGWALQQNATEHPYPYKTSLPLGADSIMVKFLAEPLQKIYCPLV